MNYHVVYSPQPTNIILPVSDAMLVVEQQLRGLSNLVPDYRDMAWLVFESISDQREALFQLSLAAKEMYDNSVDEDDSVPDVEYQKISDAFYFLGEVVFNKLNEIGAYNNGKLLYHFTEWVRGDLVLSYDPYETLTPSPIPVQQIPSLWEM